MKKKAKLIDQRMKYIRNTLSCMDVDKAHIDALIQGVLDKLRFEEELTSEVIEYIKELITTVVGDATYDLKYIHHVLTYGFKLGKPKHNLSTMLDQVIPNLSDARKFGVGPYAVNDIAIIFEGSNLETRDYTKEPVNEFDIRNLIIDFMERYDNDITVCDIKPGDYLTYSNEADFIMPYIVLLVKATYFLDDEYDGSL